MAAKAEIILAQLAGGISSDQGDIGRALAEAHPTLQQATMRLVVEFLRAMAQKPSADARNQASVDFAKTVAHGMPYLPLI